MPAVSIFKLRCQNVGDHCKEKKYLKLLVTVFFPFTFFKLVLGWPMNSSGLLSTPMLSTVILFILYAVGHQEPRNKIGSICQPGIQMRMNRQPDSYVTPLPTERLSPRVSLLFYLLIIIETLKTQNIYYTCIN